MRKVATEKAQKDIEQQLTEMSKEDHVSFTELGEAQLMDMQQKVSAYFAVSGVSADVKKATKVDNAKLQRRFLASSQRCVSIEDYVDMFYRVGSEEEAKAICEKGLEDACPNFRKQKYVDLTRRATKSKSSQVVYLYCRIQLGRVYNCGRDGRRVPFDQKPPHGFDFDSTYDAVSQTYRMWTASRTLPTAIVVVNTQAAAAQCSFPLNWSTGPMPSQ